MFHDIRRVGQVRCQFSWTPERHLDPTGLTNLGNLVVVRRQHDPVEKFALLRRADGVGQQRLPVERKDIFSRRWLASVVTGLLGVQVLESPFGLCPGDPEFCTTKGGGVLRNKWYRL